MNDGRLKDAFKEGNDEYDGLMCMASLAKYFISIFLAH